jgi:NMD protein affecting ribosome stability and mRNA decay
MKDCCRQTEAMLLGLPEGFNAVQCSCGLLWKIASWWTQKEVDDYITRLEKQLADN